MPETQITKRRLLASGFVTTSILLSSFLTTRNLALDGWMPILGFPLYLASIFVTLRYLLPGSFQGGAKSSISPTRTQPRKISTMARKDLLMLLRFFAAFLVFVMHSRIVFNINSANISKSHSWLYLSPAWLGMDIFFTLSGYLMGKIFKSGRYSLSTSGFFSYYKSRFLRIFPASIFVVLILVSFLYPLWLTNIRFILRILSFTFNGVNGPGGLGDFWSLTTELQFYILVPTLAMLVAFSLRTNKLKSLLIVVFFVLGTLTRFLSVLHYGFGFKYWNPYIYTPFYENFDIFFAGFLLAHLDKHRLPRLMNFCKIIWPFLLAIVYLGYSRVSYSSTVNGSHLATNIFIILLPGLASSITLFVILGLEEASRLWTKPSTYLSPLIKYVGSLTYSYYMLHSALMFSIQAAFPNYTYQEKLMISIPLIMLISSLIYFGIESKFHRSSTQ